MFAATLPVLSTTASTAIQLVAPKALLCVCHRGYKAPSEN